MSNPQPSPPTRFHRWRKLLLQFISGQLCIQIIGFFTGFLMLRWLSVRDYAQFGLAFAFQSTIISLIDLGFSGSVVALVGERGADKAVLGNYIRSAQYLRGRLTFLGIIAACTIFPYLSWRQGWSMTTTILLLLSILATLLCQSRMVYSAPLLINRQLPAFYKAQISALLTRLFGSIALYFSFGLSSWLAAWLGTLSIVINGSIYKKHSAHLIEEPKKHSAQYSSEMLKYLSPLMPGVIFAALQGQMTVTIIAIFGKTQGIAEVAALGRLGQMFLMLGAFNSVIIEPYIAKIARRDLPVRYAQILIAAVLLAITLTVLSFLFPQPLLWLIGPHYNNLREAVGWSVMIACVNYINGVMWTMHSARKWVYWWGSFAYIGVLVISQVLCIMTMDLSHTMGVLYFSMATTVATSFVHLATGIYGFAVGPRVQNSVDRETPSHADSSEIVINNS